MTENDIQRSKTNRALARLLYAFSFYFTKRFYTIVSTIIALFISAYFFPMLLQLGIVGLLCLAVATGIDFLFLYIGQKPVTAERQCSERFSNGDLNTVSIVVASKRPYEILVDVLDERPYQFSEKSEMVTLRLDGKQTQSFSYTVRPVVRGTYLFGNINLFLYSPLQLITRHFKAGSEQTVAVYPSFLQMRRYQLLSAASQLSETGNGIVRKSGSSMEFEQIKEYVAGDDYRTINWQATARKNALMMNSFVDERSQQVVCIIDKGRTMKMPFNGMTLLDYAINSSLVISNIILSKGDKAGLVTYSKTIDQLILPAKKQSHMTALLEALYRQQTQFTDSNTEALFTVVRQRIRQRSLLILFTNFESRYGLERQLPYLSKLAFYHSLLVVFFENTELVDLHNKPAATLEDVYTKTIAAKFSFEKRQMVKQLQQAGIMALLTPPQKLNINVINKYLEIKQRQAL